VFFFYGTKGMTLFISERKTLLFNPKNGTLIN